MKVATVAASASILLTASIIGEIAQAKPTYTMLDAGTTADGINDSGFIAGTAGYSRGFVRAPDGTMIYFDAPGEIRVSAINASGAVIGYYGDGNEIGFVREPDGTLTEFEAPDAGHGGSGYGTWATSINSSGTIAGEYADNNGAVHGFVRTGNGTITEFDVPQFYTTTANSINDSGTIAGTYSVHRLFATASYERLRGR
ncbi:MAG TPA: hypothetical protein VHU18_07835 [Rhizomicrobium sp.]|jgi:hypothetical protein|nr:hypothetical protein [Rhizomicrobium sp.]